MRYTSFRCVFCFGLLGYRVYRATLVRGTGHFVIRRHGAKVSPAVNLICRRLVFERPNRSSVRANFCDSVTSSLHYVEVKRRRGVSTGRVVLYLCFCRAYRARQLARDAPQEGVFYPHFAWVPNCECHTASAPIVTRIRRRCAELCFHRLYLNDVNANVIVCFPNLSPILAMRGANVECAYNVGGLGEGRRHAVLRDSTAPQSLRRRVPKEVFRLLHSISQDQPHLSVIDALYRRRLHHVVRVRSQVQARPHPLVTRTIHPYDGGPCYVNLYVCRGEQVSCPVLYDERSSVFSRYR